MAKSRTRPKSKRPSPQAWKFYSLEGGRLRRSKKMCPRCGRGVFMANHEDRAACGKCGFTEFKRGITTRVGR